MKIDRIIPAVIAASSILLFGCPPKESTGGAAGSNEIVIGHLASMTGGQATFGQQTDQGIRLALDEINAAGGVKGRKIQLITEDDAVEAGRGRHRGDEADHARQRDRDPRRGRLVELARGRPDRAGEQGPDDLAASTNPTVTEKGDYIFRICFIDPFQGEALAKYVANDMKLTRAAILPTSRATTRWASPTSSTNTFTALGGKIVADSELHRAATATSSPSSRRSSRRTRSRSSFPATTRRSARSRVQARDLGITVPLLGGDGWESPKLIEIGGKALEGCYYSNHYPSTTRAEVQEFVADTRRSTARSPTRWRRSATTR